MSRVLILLLSMFLVAGCGRGGGGDVSDPSKPQLHLQTSNASASTPDANSGTDDSAATGAADTAAKEEPSQPPEDFVREFFMTYLDSIGDHAWFGDRDLMSPWFSEDLTRQFLANDKACRAEDEDTCSLDFDPILDAQDYDDDVYSTLHTERIGTGAPVRVKVVFTNLGSKATMTYTLTQVDDGWRIADIQSSNYGSLVSMLSSNGAPAI